MVSFIRADAAVMKRSVSGATGGLSIADQLLMR
jgi:hypothetical protein